MAAYAAVARLEHVDVRRASGWRSAEDRSPAPSPIVTVEESPVGRSVKRPSNGGRPFASSSR